MKGLVFSGFEVPNLGGYDMVIYLLIGGYNLEPVEKAKIYYSELMGDWEQDGLRSYISSLGLYDEHLFFDLVIRSNGEFNLFIQLLKEEYPIVFDNFLNQILSLDLKKVINALANRKGSSVFVGELGSVPFLNIKLYLERFPQNNVKVVDSICSYCNVGSQKNRFIAIDGKYLARAKNFYPISGVPIFISDMNYCPLPGFINTQRNRVFMVNKAYGAIIVKGYIIF